MNLKQTEHALNWLQSWYERNLTVLKTTGIQAIKIKEEYVLTTPFPMGNKTFFPLLKKIKTGGPTIEKINFPRAAFYVVME